MRPVERNTPAHNLIYAVFSDNPGLATAEYFLGLVPETLAARYPGRIFADLLPTHCPTPVAATSPLHELLPRMDESGIDALPVVAADGRFIGVVTRTSLLSGLLDQEQALLAKTRYLHNTIEQDHQRLKNWSDRLERLNRMLGELFVLTARNPSESELFISGVRLLARLLGAHSGAAGILDEVGRVSRYFYTSESPDEREDTQQHAQPVQPPCVEVGPQCTACLESAACDEPLPTNLKPCSQNSSPLVIQIVDDERVYGHAYLCHGNSGNGFTEDDRLIADNFSSALSLALSGTRERDERKVIEDAAREMERDYRRLTENLPGIVYRFYTGPHPRWQVFNCMLEPITGYHPEELPMNQVLALSSLILPEDRPKVLEALQRADETRLPFEMSYRIRHRNGSVRHLLDRGRPIHDAAGSPFIDGVILDLTEHKQAEERQARLLVENRYLARRLVTVQEEERRHLARELHDELGQSLTAIRADAQLISVLAKDCCPEACASADAISEVSVQAYDSARLIMQRLRPPMLDRLGLVSTLQESVEHWQRRNPKLQWELIIDESVGGLSDEINITAYRIIQEAVTNVIKHSCANKVELVLSNAKTPSGASMLEIRIRDDGRGTNPDRPHLGLGLIGMRERVLGQGGQFEIRSQAGQGTEICAWLPKQGLENTGQAEKPAETDAVSLAG